MQRRMNATAITINIIAVLILIGGTYLSYLRATPTHEKIIWQLFIMPEFVTVISSMVLFAFAEIIKILHDMRADNEEIEDVLQDIHETNIEVIKAINRLQSTVNKNPES